MADIIRDIPGIREKVADLRNEGRRVALIPTMGALHNGHMALIKTAEEQAYASVISIFVNPTQFGPSEDFDAYPRKEAADISKCDQAGVDAVYLPSVEVMYPQGFATSISVEGITKGLCGASRPGHFDGVATVVAKLLNQVEPDMAVFGEKDFQQLLLIKRMVADLDIHTKIMGAPTHRENDGLASSSRNAYLEGKEREIAPKFYTTLMLVKEKLEAGDPLSYVLSWGSGELLKAGFKAVEYMEVRTEEALSPVEESLPKKACRLLAAVRLGDVRLIDNITVRSK